MKNRLKAFLFVALLAMFVVMYAIVTPWCVNEGGWIGSGLLPFLWLLFAIVAYESICFIIKSEKVKNG